MEAMRLHAPASSIPRQACMGMKGLKTQTWILQRWNKFASDYVPRRLYTVNLVVGVKWMQGPGHPTIPDVLETNSEVRSAIEFMTERGFEDYFYVTCYLTFNTKAEVLDKEFQDDNESFDNTERAGEQCPEYPVDTKKRTKGKFKGWDGEC